MNTLKVVAVIFLVAIALGTAVPPAGSQDNKPAQPGSQSQAAAVPVYKPPLLGAPGGRVGGGTRGPARDMFVLSALAPNHTGTTATDQPSLYWFISGVTPYPVEVTVVDSQGADPLLEKRFPPPVEPGVQRIRLADYGVHLAPGVSYRWFVAVVPDSARRSKDILAGGTIERVEASEELKGKMARAAKTELPFLYAEAGLWYDAVTAISELIEAAPQDQALRKERAAMLVQVGLPEIGE
jgi:hypothetical protein